jgi:FkbM family methyltransferase
MKENLERILSEIKPYDLNDYTVVVFGAGNTSVLYQKCFIQEEIKPVYYIDNSISKQNTIFQGVQVISLEKLVSLEQTFAKPILVLICSSNIDTCNQIKTQLQNHSLLYTTVDSIVFGKNKQKILEVYDFLEDEISKEIYTQVMQSRVLNIPVPEELVNTDPYFCLPQFFTFFQDEVFVDLGAYTGDTVERYINTKLGVFHRIYAFEPDKQNFTAMTYRTERLRNEWGLSNDKLVLVRAGAGIKTEQVLFTPPPIMGGSAARLGANFSTDKTDTSEEISLFALDDYFKEQRVSFIKADIESYELDMLRGAESIIKRDKPLLVVCLYHSASDMYTVPLFIKGLNSDYKMKIRHHTYGLWDTVLYAYIKQGEIG